MSVRAIAAAAAITSSRFFGLTADSANPSAPALTGVNESTVRIHFGSDTCSSPRGRPRHSLTATHNSSTPSARSSALTQPAGCPWSLGPAPPEASSTIAPTRDRPRIQPRSSAGPLERARGVASISTTPMIGNGLSATPTPYDRI